MIFVDQDGTRYQGRLEPEASHSGHPIEVLVLVPAGGGKPERVEAYGRCPFFLIEATLDERSRLDRAGYHLRAARRPGS
jgi:hypothetical protein